MSTGSIFFSQSGGNSLIKAASTYSNLLLSGNFTIEFFMKCGSSVNDYDYPHLISENVDYSLTTSYTFHVSHPDEHNKVSVFNGKQQYQTSNPTNLVLSGVIDVTDNQWHHVAVVRSGTSSNNTKMYDRIC
jgi:hypothetical protein